MDHWIQEFLKDFVSLHSQGTLKILRLGGGLLSLNVLVLNEIPEVYRIKRSHLTTNSNSNSNWTFIALNLPKQEDSKAQQNKKQSTKFCVQGHNRGRTPRRTPGG